MAQGLCCTAVMDRRLQGAQGCQDSQTKRKLLLLKQERRLRYFAVQHKANVVGLALHSDTMGALGQDITNNLKLLDVHMSAAKIRKDNEEREFAEMNAQIGQLEGEREATIYDAFRDHLRSFCSAPEHQEAPLSALRLNLKKLFDRRIKGSLKSAAPCAHLPPLHH